MSVKLYRITCGSIALLVVDLIWVLSAELTEYLFRGQAYDKPFFTAYVKTSLFTAYLLGFVVCREWRQLCGQWPRLSSTTGANGPDIRLASNGGASSSASLSSSTAGSTQLYSILDSSGDHNESPEEDDEGLESDDNVDEDNAGGGAEDEPPVLLSEPIWVPIKYSASDAGSTGSTAVNSGADATESESEARPKSGGRRAKRTAADDRSTNGRSSKSVRFSRLTEVRHMSGAEAEEALLARLSYQATIRAQQAREATARAHHQRLTVSETVKLALIFAWLWFTANWSYQLALKYSEAGVANLLSSTCALFAIVLAPALPSHAVSDSFSLTKLVAVVVSVASVAVITTAQSPIETVDSVPVGALWALCGAFFYALYTVVLRHKVSNEDHLNIPMFFGFVGLFNLLFLWPAFFILDYSQLEVFEWPTRQQWCIILVNGLIGTVLSEFLWLWACFLTSSLLASLSVSLTIPLTILMDGLLRGVSYPRMFFLGTIPLYLSFVAISVLSHYDSWDPLAELLLRLVRHSVLRKPVIRGSDPLYSEQSQSLIGDQNNSSA